MASLKEYLKVKRHMIRTFSKAEVVSLDGIPYELCEVYTTGQTEGEILFGDTVRFLSLNHLRSQSSSQIHFANDEKSGNKFFFDSRTHTVNKEGKTVSIEDFISGYVSLYLREEAEAYYAHHRKLAGEHVVSSPEMSETEHEEYVPD